MFMKTKLIALVVGLFFVGVSPLRAELPRPTFYAPFDADATAVIAAGDPKPNGAAVIVPDGRFGGAAKFGPMTGVAYPIAGNLPADRGTIAFWVKAAGWADDAATRTLLNAGLGAPYYTYGPQLAIQKTGLNGGVSVSWGAATPAIAWTNGPWHHIAVVYCKSWSKVYVNGVEQARSRGAAYDEPPRGSFFVGNTPYIGNWAKTGDTYIDDFRIYPAALDDDQVAAVFHGFEARLSRLQDGRWSVAVALDPVLRGVTARGRT